MSERGVSENCLTPGEGEAERSRRLVEYALAKCRSGSHSIVLGKRRTVVVVVVAVEGLWVVGRRSSHTVQVWAGSIVLVEEYGARTEKVRLLRSTGCDSPK